MVDNKVDLCWENRVELGGGIDLGGENRVDLDGENRVDLDGQNRFRWGEFGRFLISENH